MSQTQPDRRNVTFNSLDDLVRDLQAFAGQRPASTGKWTAAQNVEHVALLIDASVEGFPFKLPLLGLLGRLMRSHFLRKGFKPGIKPQAKAAKPFAPALDMRWVDAVSHLTQAIEQAKQKKMTAVSPLFGAMSHEQWEQLHCRHAELHFSFIKPGPPLAMSEQNYANTQQTQTAVQ